jgi:FixJ family two-component response regulator
MRPFHKKSIDIKEFFNDSSGLLHIVMPEMNGKNLAERLQSLYPRHKTLFMSGYTASVMPSGVGCRE